MNNVAYKYFGFFQIHIPTYFEDYDKFATLSMDFFEMYKN